MTQSLLPSFVTGRLDAAERRQVEAHLGDCAACRADERLERRLEAELSAMPIVVAPEWTRRKPRLPGPPPRQPRAGVLARLSSSRRADVADPPGGPGRRGWAIAAQAVAMLLVMALSLFLARPAAPTVKAHDPTSGAPPPPSPADDLLVRFRPETTERVLRGILADNGARIVDGPTAAGAWDVRAPAALRPAVLAALRRRPEVADVRPSNPGAPS